MKKILVLALAIFSTVAFAQKEKQVTFNKETNLIDVVYYHANGKISQSGSYTAEGKLQGEWLSYDDKGNKLVLANYNNGKKVGKWFYYTNETVKEVDYSNNAIASLKESEIQ